MLRNFTEYIVELPLKIQVRNVRNYLKAFESAMKLKDIPPTVSTCEREERGPFIRLLMLKRILGNRVVKIS